MLPCLMKNKGYYDLLVYYFVHAYFRSDLLSDLFDDFTLSFTGDGYLFTESLFSVQPGDGSVLTFVIKIKPFSTEGLVMFAYDEQVCINN